MTTHQSPAAQPVALTIRPLYERELPEADRIVRVAFGTFLGVPNPETFMGDADVLWTRWKADPTRVFANEPGYNRPDAYIISDWR